MLPFISSIDLKTGGNLKETVSDFVVEEIPLYLPSGKGQHIYLLLKREGKSTKEVVEDLISLFDIKETDLGVAGLKDKHAITTQWFSLSLGINFTTVKAEELIKEKLEYLTILEVSRHTNKLKTSHLIGNKFEITLRNCIEGAYRNALSIKTTLEEKGVPNYYGKQRFGSKGTNHIVGKEVLLKTKKLKKHWMKKLMLSAYQSHLFNTWLANRINDNYFSSLIEGDLLQGVDQQRPFPFSNERDHELEFKEQKISYTGPMFGNKVSTPTGDALLREIKLLNDEEITLEDFKAAKLPGARRIAHIFIKDLEISEKESSLVFSFSLPKGSYATSLIREFTKE